MTVARSATDTSHLFVNYRPAPIAFVRGEGARLWDDSGREYVDLLGGIATVSLGHAHPRLLEALGAQLERYHHVSNLFEIPEQAAAAAALVAAARSSAPAHRRLERVFFCNSGAEANEAAIKLARKYAWRKAQSNAPESRAAFEIVVTENGFHGRTLGALAATGTPAYHQGFGPLPGGFVCVPFGDLEAAAAAMSERTCAVLVEPIQGEGGVNPARPSYLRGLQRLCREHGALFMLDEVQTGMGRLGGTMFAFQKWELEPDVLVLAKGLGGGIPVGAVLARDEVAQALQPGDHGSTYGGNALATTAVSTVLSVIEEDGLLERVEEAGARLRSGLESIAERTGAIESVRGEGLMLAAQLRTEAAPVAAACLRQGVLVNAVRPHAIRFLPPLVITDADIDLGLERFEKALRSVGEKP